MIPSTKKINCIKEVLAVKGRTDKWLEEQLGCALTTVSKWCTNAAQPTLETIVQIVRLLEVGMNEPVGVGEATTPTFSAK